MAVEDKPPVALASTRFTQENYVGAHRLFLWHSVRVAPFTVPAPGWKITGYGKAPWPGSTAGIVARIGKMTFAPEEGFAVMFEKVAAASKSEGLDFDGAEVPEGTRVWQHGRPEWVPGLRAYRERMALAAKSVPTRRRTPGTPRKGTQNSPRSL